MNLLWSNRACLQRVNDRAKILEVEVFRGVGESFQFGNTIEKRGNMYEGMFCKRFVGAECSPDTN
jgi:hypothetical protein